MDKETLRLIFAYAPAMVLLVVAAILAITNSPAWLLLLGVIILFWPD